MRWSDGAFGKLIEGTFLATLLLAAQEGGRPFSAAAWILVGALLTSVVDAYATHMSAPHGDGVSSWFASMYRGLRNNWARVAGALPTVSLLIVAGLTHWRADEHDHHGGGTVGYETVILNVNVVLLFVFGIFAAHRSGSSWRATLLFALLNAGLGWLIVVLELSLE